MGNKRATYIMGSIIASLAVTLAFVAIIPAITETPTASTSLNAMGHLVMKVYDPDGTLVHYIQTDNFIAKDAKTSVFEGLFADGTLKTGAGPYQFLALCQGSGGAGAFAATDSSDLACSGGALGSEMTKSRLDGTLSAAASFTADPNYRVVFTGTITVPQGDTDETFGELALFDQASIGAGNIFAVADFADLRLFSNQEVNLRYTITMTG